MEIDEVLVAVERSFARTAAGLERWADPHPAPERVVVEEEYSRVTNPAKWRIIGARADAWIDALVAAGVAWLDPDVDVRWSHGPRPAITRADALRPVTGGGLSLLVCRSRIQDVPDVGVTLAVGDPAEIVTFIPDCGCDACDSGSQDVIDELDSYVRPVVTGEFRFLRRGRQSIMVLGDGCRQSANIGLRDGVDDILADPDGWDEWSGPSWLHGPPGRPRQ